jgi:hypothetical protein
MGINGLTSTIVSAKEIGVDMVGLAVMRGRHGGVDTHTHTRMHTRTWTHAHVMSTHTSILVDSVGPPSTEVCRTAASFP